MNEQLLNRREFNGLCVALGTPFFSVDTMIVPLSGASARAATPMVKFHNGTIVPACVCRRMFKSRIVARMVFSAEGLTAGLKPQNIELS
jgi:hypothetical protein